MSSASADKSSLRKLFQLQETDVALGQAAESQRRVAASLKDNQSVVKAKAVLEAALKRETELKEAQHKLEWEIDDLSSKINAAQEKLYSGKVGNPKELASLQQESQQFQVNRRSREDRELEIMEQLEAATAAASAARRKFEATEAAWREEHSALLTEAGKLKAELAALEAQRRDLTAALEPSVVQFYERLRAGKGRAVVTVEQGVCSGCRISLFTAQLRQARMGNLVQCGNCGRILYVA